MPDEARDRKVRSETLLERDGIPINRHLPVIETTADARLRSKPEIAYRTLARLPAALRAEGLERSLVEKLAKDYGFAPHFTPRESAFIQSEAPSQTDRIQFTWRHEAAWVILWAISFIEELGEPSTICGVQKAVSIMKNRTAAQFVADAKPRPLAQGPDESDLIYRYDWAVVDARVNNRPAPPGLDPGVVQERHYALNWPLGYMDQDWDDVSTDT